MARLPKGSKERRSSRIMQLIRGSYGIRESEIANELGVDRRTANNYLRQLQRDGKAYRDGWEWHPDS